MVGIIKGIWELSLRYIFSAFDLFPSPKGAATHIASSVTGMARHFGSANLLCLGNAGYPAVQQEGDVRIRRCLAHHPNFLRRTLFFGRFVRDALDETRSSPELIHFRDIWSGVPLCDHDRTRDAKKIFEVNGLPSIELAYHYPGLLNNHRLLDRFRRWEDRLLEQADQVVTVSEVSRRLLHGRGVPADRLTVIPNCAPIAEHPCSSKEPYILYVGTLAPWQGVGTLIRAMRLLKEECGIGCRIVASTRKHLKPTRKLIRKLGLDERISIRVSLERSEVAKLYRRALCSVAPLSRCDRNELQGCSPLKILESMGQGTPVAAADLPVTREMITDGRDGRLFTPDSPRSLADALLWLLSSRERLDAISIHAMETIEERFGESNFHARLRTLYNDIRLRGRYGH